MKSIEAKKELTRNEKYTERRTMIKKKYLDRLKTIFQVKGFITQIYIKKMTKMLFENLKIKKRHNIQRFVTLISLRNFVHSYSNHRFS